MIEVAKLILPKWPKRQLKNWPLIPPEQWVPIVVNRFKVIDGIQRVLHARRYNILHIPSRDING